MGAGWLNSAKAALRNERGKKNDGFRTKESSGIAFMGPGIATSATFCPCVAQKNANQIGIILPGNTKERKEVGFEISLGHFNNSPKIADRELRLHQH